MEENIIKMEKFDIQEPIEEDSNNSDKKKDEKETEKKSCCSFPTAYTILIVTQVLIFLLTYIMKKGKFDTIEYDSSSKKFIIKHLDEVSTVNATQEILTHYNIVIPLENFEKGYIKKPVAIPGTYTQISKNQNFFRLFEYPMLGIVESADISFLLIIFGGDINILIEMKALSGAMKALSRVTKGKEIILLIVVYLIIAICGSTIGLYEEILALYPIFMKIFLKCGFDGMLSAAPIHMATVLGNMLSILNPFEVVIASYSAGISITKGLPFRIIAFVLGNALAIGYILLYYRRIKNNETNSLVYESKKEIEDLFLKDKENDDEEKTLNEIDENSLLKNKKKEDNEFTIIQKISLILFGLAFALMSVGIIIFNWLFSQMATVFLMLGIILIFLLRKGEKEGIKAFLKGAGESVGIGFIIGMARGINQTLDKGNISDTILNSLSKLFDGLPKVVFAFLMLIIYMILGLPIQSCSALAVLSMPVFAPLADKVSCGRNVVIDAFMFGQNLVGFITPTGVLLIMLELVGIKYSQWIKFIWPFLVALFVLLFILIIIDAAIN